MPKVTPHFSAHEFDRMPNMRPGFEKFQSRVPYPPAWVKSRLAPLCQALEVIRAKLGNVAIRIGSGYREPAYNAKIGGAKASQHMAGRAADITVSGVAPRVVHDLILDLYNEGLIKIGGLGYYPPVAKKSQGFVHVDVRPTTKLVRWTGSRAEN